MMAVMRAAVVLAGLTLLGCHGAIVRPAMLPRTDPADAMPDTATVLTACAAPQSPSALPLPSPALVLSTQVSPPRAGIEVTVRIEGETSRSSVKINPSQPARFELAAGLYDVRVSLDGYVGAQARVRLAAGCVTQLSTMLRARAKQR